MLRAYVLAIVLGFGCGSVNDSPDTRIDAHTWSDAPQPDTRAPRCNPSAPFGAPMPMSSLNTADYDESARLSPDELTVYFSSTRAGGPGGWDLWMATRSDTGTMFGDASAIPGANTAALERGPTITADGLALYALVGASPNYDIGVATRSSLQDSFGSLSALTQPNGAMNDADPYVLPSGAALYFASDRSGNDELYRSPKSAAGFSAPSLVTGVDVMTSSNEANPVVSPDELVLYFGSDRAGGSGNYDIYRASRTSTADGFGAAVNLSSLNTGGLEVPTWVSADDCEIYLTRLVANPGSNYDLYVAMRGM